LFRQLYQPRIQDFPKGGAKRGVPEWALDHLVKLSEIDVMLLVKENFHNLVLSSNFTILEDRKR